MLPLGAPLGAASTLPEAPAPQRGRELDLTEDLAHDLTEHTTEDLDCRRSCPQFWLALLVCKSHGEMGGRVLVCAERRF